MSDPKYLVWLDLETTGSDERYDPIIEIGFVVTDRQLEIKKSFQEVCQVSDVVSYREHADPVVEKMHDKNGLWDELPNALSLLTVEQEAIKCLAEFGKRGDFVLCGSGVAHFDRRFLKAQMMTFDRWFRHYVIDVGVLRRTCALIGREDLLLPFKPEDKTHRALEDAVLHLKEFTYLKQKLTKE